MAELKASPRNFLTLYLKPSLPFPLEGLLTEAKLSSYFNEIKEALETEVVLRKAEEYNTGAAIFWGENEERYIILPPFPFKADKVSLGTPDTLPLEEVLNKRYILGVVLVTWGSYSIGVFEGDNLIDSKIGTGYIQKRHRKGGRSEKRFARRTEEQKKDFLRKVSNRIEERFQNYPLDFIFFGGNRLIRKPLLKESRYLETKAEKISRRVLNIRYADKEALTNSLEELTKSLVFTF